MRRATGLGRGTKADCWSVSLTMTGTRSSATRPAIPSPTLKTGSE